MNDSKPNSANEIARLNGISIVIHTAMHVLVMETLFGNNWYQESKFLLYKV